MSDLVASGSCDGRVRLWRVDRHAKCLVPAAYAGRDKKRKDADAEARALAAAGKDAPLTYNQALHASSFAAPGYVNGLWFAPDGTFLVAAVSREHRLGRWAPLADAHEGLVLMRLDGAAFVRSPADDVLAPPDKSDDAESDL